MELHELMEMAEDLKANLWAYMESNDKEHKGLKETMNELLDLMDELRTK